MEDILIVDNSPFSYMFQVSTRNSIQQSSVSSERLLTFFLCVPPCVVQPDNAIPITSWFNDKSDRQLYELLPFLDSMLHVDDVSHVLQRRKPAYGSGVGVPVNLLPPGWQPTVQDPDVMNAQQRRGQ